MSERIGRTMTVNTVSPGTSGRLVVHEKRDYGRPNAMIYATVRIRVRSGNRKQRDLWAHWCRLNHVNFHPVEETGTDDARGIYSGRFNADGTPFVAPHSTTWDVSGAVVDLDRLIGYPQHVLIIGAPDWSTRRVYGAAGAGECPRRVERVVPMPIPTTHEIDHKRLNSDKVPDARNGIMLANGRRI